MIRPYANLHTHSTHSDGIFSPEELVMTAKAEGYRALAVTDHDTVTANAEVARVCEREGMEHLFGAEFTSPYDKNPDLIFHIVGFDFDPDYPPMKAYLDSMAARETDQTEIIFGWAVEQGNITGITWQEVLDYNRGITWICNDHVFRAMLAKGLVSPLELNDWFLKNFDKQRSMVPPSHPFLTASGIIRLIREAGGIAVLAHPHKQLGYVDDLISMGLSGIEVYHPDLTPAEQIAALGIAYEKGLFIAGGTDHDGLCGGMYSSFADPKTSPFYHEPHSFGTMEQHFRELKSRSLEGRVPLPEVYTAIGSHH